MGLNLGVEVFPILHDSRDDQLHSHPPRYFNRLSNTFLRMDAPEKQKVLPLSIGKGELRNVNTMMDSADVIELRRFVCLADRHIMGATIVFFVDGQD